MPKPILFLQFRTGAYAEREITAFCRNVNDAQQRTDFVNVLTQPTHLPLLSLAQHDCIILGGSGEVDLLKGKGLEGTKQMLREIKPIMKTLLHQDIPTFGICLGFELIGYFLGTPTIYDLAYKEHGTYQVCLTSDGKVDPLFCKMPDRFFVQQGHVEALPVVPKDCVLLAKNSPRCPIQAIRYKHNIYGVQFHPEMTLEDWKENTQLYMKHNPETGYSLTGDWADHFDLHESPHALKLLQLFISTYTKKKL